jgi:S1-C subfamily serine protease
VVRIQQIPIVAVLWLFGVSSLYAGIEIGVGCIDADPRGAKVIDVKDPGYAKQMGITTGDVIIMLNGKRVDKADALARELATADSVTITWRRGEKYFRAGVVKVVRTSEFGGYSFQVVVMMVEPPEKTGLDVIDDRGKGARVKKVENAGLGKDLGIEVGDLIVRANGNVIDSVETLKIQEELGGRFESVLWLRGKACFLSTVHFPRPQLDQKVEPARLIRRGQHPAEMLGLDWEAVRDDKVRVTNVRAGSWSDEIGLRAGDLLLRANGDKIGDPALVEPILADALPEPELVWKRGDNLYVAQQSFSVEAVGRQFEERHFLRSRHKLAPIALGVHVVSEDRGGAKITKVSADEAGRRLRMLPGDVVVSVNGIPIKTGKEFEEELALFETGTIEWRRGDKHYKAQVDWEALGGPGASVAHVERSISSDAPE